MEDVLLVLAVAGAALFGFTIAGLTGFGGVIILLPVLVWAFGVREAIPVLTIAQIMGNLGRMWLWRNAIDWPLTLRFSLGAIPASVIGAFLFVEVPTSVLMRILGAALLLMVIYTHTPLGRLVKPPLWAFTPLGAIFGVLVGFLGAPGPFMTSFYLSYGLTSGSYLGTSSIAMVIAQTPKTAVFAGNGLFTLRATGAGFAVGLLAVLGALLGQWLLGRISANVFTKLIDVLLVTSGILFLIRG